VTIRSTGLWWRCSGYEIRDGYVWPVQGSTVEEYDPWNVEKARSIPYLALSKLVGASGPIGNRTYALLRKPLRPEQEAAIIAWCEQYGLLGILPHQVQDAVFPPGTRHQRRVSRLAAEGHAFYVEESAHFGSPAQPRILLRNFVHPRLQAVPFDSVWPRYFPRNTARTADTPEPLSERFWRDYAEPLQEFVTTAIHFVRMVDLVSDPRRAEAMEEEDYGPTGHELLQAALENLALMGSGATSSVGIEQARDDGIYYRCWATPSLLSAMAVMLSEYILGGQTLIRCQGCSTLAVRTRDWKTYCSRRCSRAAEMQRYRAKARSAIGSVLRRAFDEFGSAPTRRLLPKLYRRYATVDRMRRVAQEGDPELIADVRRELMARGQRASQGAIDRIMRRLADRRTRPTRVNRGRRAQNSSD
jgi:hypothetical protein